MTKDVDEPTNGWREWGKHVLSELERNERDHTELKNSQVLILSEIAALKVKSGMWGAVGGAIPVIVALAIMALQGCAILNKVPVEDPPVIVLPSESVIGQVTVEDWEFLREE